METIDNDVRITINLTDLVNIRADFLDLDYDDLDTCDRENIINDLRTTLTWDTLYYMIDNCLLEEVGQADTHYGETAGNEPAATYEKNRQQFKIVKLESPSWTIDVPVRKKK